MMKKPFSVTARLIACPAAVGMVLHGHAATAADTGTDPWSMRATIQAVAGSYNDADLRDSLYSGGFFLGGDYLEQGGFTAGYTYTEIDGKGSGPGTFDTLEENTFYLSGKLHSYPDSLPGRLTWRLDGYLINDDSSGRGNQGGAVYAGADADIGVLNPIIAYMNHEKSLGLDLGYAYSNYDYDGGDEFQAHQITPTVGFALGDPSNWLQLRLYYIHLSEDDANDGNSDTTAVEAKFTHWLAPGAALGLHSVGLNVVAGDRFLAVDSDAAVVYTLADEQQGAVALNGVFNLSQQTSVMLQVGYEKYENHALNNDYDSAYLYLNLSHKW